MCLKITLCILKMKIQPCTSLCDYGGEWFEGAISPSVSVWGTGEVAGEATDMICVQWGHWRTKGPAFPQLVFQQNTAVLNCTCAQRPLLSQYRLCLA